MSRITGAARGVLLLGVLVGLALLGGIMGAGIDYAAGDAGWWGLGALAGLMAGAIIAAVLVEDSGGGSARRTSRAL